MLRHRSWRIKDIAQIFPGAFPRRSKKIEPRREKKKKRICASPRFEQRTAAFDQMLGKSTMVLYPVAKPVKALMVGYINYTQLSAQVKHTCPPFKWSRSGEYSLQLLSKGKPSECIIINAYTFPHVCQDMCGHASDWVYSFMFKNHSYFPAPMKNPN